MPMDFTYASYGKLIDLLMNNGYNITNYHKYTTINNPCILRHDIDLSLEKSVEFALYEAGILKQYGNANATYFVLVSSDFYNIFTKANLNCISKLSSLGNEIGLHFDETKYNIDGNKLLFIEYVEKEIYLLNRMLDINVSVVSMHRPSRFTLDCDFQFPSAKNSYSNEFFNYFKYLSDSRMAWREDIFSVVESRQYDKLHVLTHPFWYSEKKEGAKEKLIGFISRSKMAQYERLSENIRDIQEFVSLEDVRI